MESYNETSGVLLYRVGGDAQLSCVRLRLNGTGVNRQISEVRAYNTDTNFANCALLLSGSTAVCMVRPQAGRERAADLSTLVDVSTLKAGCKVSEWSSDAECSVPCGGGTLTRRRKILITTGGNSTCPALSDTVPCNVNPCGGEFYAFIVFSIVFSSLSPFSFSFQFSLLILKFWLIFSTGFFFSQRLQTKNQ